MKRFHGFLSWTSALVGFLSFSTAVCAYGGPHQRERDQNLEQSPLTSAAAKSRVTESRIGPDDLLDVSVFEASEMNCTVRVSTSGDFSFPMLGPVRAAGLTPEQLESVLEELLRRSYIKDPHVRVFVRELHSHSVSVVGAVKMPGVFQIQGAKPLLEIVSMAQGLSDDAGDTVLITRSAALAEPEAFASGASAGGGGDGDGDGQSEPRDGPATEKINLKKLLGASDPALNVPVYPGDTVTVTHAGLVYVVGEVHKPGGFVVKNGENVSVLQALALAEGLTRTSSVKQARIIRTEVGTGARAEIPLNLGKVLSGKLPDPILQLDDIVFVPNSLAKGALFRGSEAALVAATGAAIYRW
jgi:polysaccharide export outer membrane protein